MYEHYDDINAFNSLDLDRVVPSANINKVSNELIAVVTYKTRYTDLHGKAVTLRFGLRKLIKAKSLHFHPFFRDSAKLHLITKDTDNVLR